MMYLMYDGQSMSIRANKNGLRASAMIAAAIIVGIISFIIYYTATGD